MEKKKLEKFSLRKETAGSLTSGERWHTTMFGEFTHFICCMASGCILSSTAI